MDYENRYNEALRRATEYHFDGVKQCIADTLEYIFPELKENKDEKIKKALIDYFDDANKADENPLQSYGIYTDKAIAWLEQQIDVNKDTYEIAEKEKKDFVSVPIECRASFDEFEEDNSYWFEYIGDDTYIGKSDNILNKKFHITPRQLFTLFTQQHCPKEEEANAPSEYGKYVDECLYDASKHFFSEGEDKYSVADLFYAGVRCGKNWIDRQKENLSENPCEDCINDKGCINCENGSMKETKKNSDNNEPLKFKVGDIIKHNNANIVCKVISVNNGSYYVKNVMTNGEIELFNAEQNFHLWRRFENQCEKEQKFNNVVQIPDGCHAYIKDRKIYIEEY